MVIKKEMRMKEMEMDDLGEELLEEIFSRVHLKPLTRMKCVSKDWCRLISHITKSRLRLNHFGLIWLDTGMLEEEWEEVLESGVDPKSRTHIRLFDVSVRGGHLEYLENKAFRFTLDDSYSSLCFSNGLLLCKELFNFEGEPILYDVSLKQLIHLPSVAEFICGHTICMGLAFDGLPNRHFKLVCLCFNGNIDFSYYVIFSSETGEWKKHRARVSNYSSKDNHNVPNRNERFSGPFLQYECLFHKGLIYWALYGYFIVYNLEDDFFEIHDLPKTQHSEDECLWVSEGCLHYACSDKDGFSIWTRVRGVEIYSDDEYFKNEDNRLVLQHDVGSWKLKHTIELRCEEPYIIRFLKPCAFDEDFQILYLENLELSISLLSCSIETGCLREVKKM